MTTSALLVIDMLNEYLSPQGKIYCEPCREIIPSVSQSILFAHTHRIPVFFVNTSLTSSHVLLAKKWGLHAVAGSWGAKVIDELPIGEDDVIINKKGYNGFSQTQLENELKKRNISAVALTGIHTHVCVLLTAAGAFELGYDVTVLEDCVTTYDKATHTSRLKFISTHLGDVLSLEEWMKR